MRRAALVASALLAFVSLLGCKKGDRKGEGAPRPATAVASVSGDPAAPGTPRIGMAWVPSGTLVAGTLPEKTPRVPDEEMPGVPIEMGGFYIDLLPWPNEPNAIATTSVTRDEAQALCAGKGKRLCSELEWERACKGPTSTTYEYGDVYRKDVCETGEAPEQAARRPAGEHATCKSGFGVSEMHGGVFEWTSSSWGRGSKDGAQGVLRGGNAVVGELVGRCSNAIARAPGKKSTTMGFRCCAGPANDAEVKLELTGTPGLVLGAASYGAPLTNALSVVVGNTVDAKLTHAWRWVPSANEELIVTTGCSIAPRACGLVVGRGNKVLATVPTNSDPGELTRGADTRHLRVRSLDSRGVLTHDIAYVYGRVDVSEAKRP